MGKGYLDEMSGFAMTQGPTAKDHEPTDRERLIDLIDTAATEAERQLVEACQGKCQPPTVAGVLLALRAAVSAGSRPATDVLSPAEFEALKEPHP